MKRLGLSTIGIVAFFLATGFLSAQNIRQDLGLDGRVDYKSLTQFGPWDDRNYQLTLEDIAMLSDKETERSGRIPAFFRVEMRRMFPDWDWDGHFEYPRSASQYFKILYGGLLVDGVIEGDDRQSRGIPVPVNGELQLNQVLGANESTVEINPVFPDQVIAGSNNNGGQEMYYSDDGGQTWTIQGVFPGTCCDPTVDWSSDGTIAYAGALSNGIGVNVYRSTDFGHTWSSPVILTTTGSDKEFIHVDRSPSSPFLDNLYITYHNGNVMQFRRSTDLGLSFDPAIAFGAAPRGIGSDITTDSAGNIYNFYGAFNERQIIMLKSTDGGVTFQAPFVVASTNGSFDWPIPAMESRNAWIYCGAASDISGGPFHDSIYVTWTDTEAPETGVAANNHTQVHVYYSRDGGATWASSIPHDTADVMTVDRFNQWIFVDTNGTVHSVYYDTRHSTNRTGVDFYYTFSTDGAVTWNEPTRITSQTSANLTDGQEWGDYNGISVALEKIIPTWTDNRDGPPNMKDVYVADVLNVTAAPTFTLSGSPLNQTICAPASLQDITLNVGQLLGFTNDVTLSFTGLPAGFTGGFSTNPVTPPGQTMVMLSADGTVTAGAYQIVINGSATGTDDKQITVNVAVQTAIFAPPTLVSPANGEPNGGVGTVPLGWDAVPGATGYHVQVSETSDFAAPIIDQTTMVNSFVATGLTQGLQYFWRVATINACGEGAFSAAFNFIANAETVLLVDQDNNAPDERTFFTDTLDALAISYKIFDATAVRPTAVEMAGHPMVIWFTGDLALGPNNAEAAELATYIDGGGKLFLASEDYLWPFRPDVPPFGMNYLGIDTVVNDGGDYTSVSPVAGSIFDGLPTSTLVYPAGLSDFSDHVTANGNGVLSLIGNNGNGAAIVTDDTVFFAFPFSTIANNGTRITSTEAQDILSAIVDHLINLEACALSDLDVDAGKDEEVCDDFTLQAMATGGTGPGTYSYSWEPAGLLDDPTSATPSGTLTENTTFTVTVTDQDSCIVIDSITLTYRPQYDVSLLEFWLTGVGADVDGNGIVDARDYVILIDNLADCQIPK